MTSLLGIIILRISLAWRRHIGAIGRSAEIRSTVKQKTRAEDAHRKSNDQKHSCAPGRLAVKASSKESTIPECARSQLPSSSPIKRVYQARAAACQQSRIRLLLVASKNRDQFLLAIECCRAIRALRDVVRERFLLGRRKLFPCNGEKQKRFHFAALPVRQIFILFLPHFILNSRLTHAVRGSRAIFASPGIDVFFTVSSEVPSKSPIARSLIP